MNRKELLDALNKLKAGYIASLNTLEMMKGWGKTQLEALYATRIGVFKIQILELQIELKALKKKIKLCHQYINKNEEPPFDEIEQKVRKMVEEVHKEIREEKHRVDFGKAVLSNLASPEDTIESKRIFRKVAKILHPDVNPHLSTEQQEIWHLFYTAYKSGDLDKLKALEVVYADEILKMQEKADEIPEEEILLSTATLKQGIIELEEQIEKLNGEFPYNIADQIRDDEWVEEQQNLLKQEIKEWETAVKEKREIYQLIREAYE